MAELKTWLLGKLLWDPAQDDVALTQRFLASFYGPKVAPLMAEYMQLFFDAAAKDNTTLGPEDNCIPGPAPCEGKMGYLSPATTLKSLAIFQRAAKLQDDPELAFRLAVAQLPTLYVILIRWDYMVKWADANGHAWPLPRNISEVYESFASVYRRRGMDHNVWCEAGQGRRWLTDDCIRDNALGEWSGAGLPWFSKQIGAVVLKTEDAINTSKTRFLIIMCVIGDEFWCDFPNCARFIFSPCVLDC